MITENISIPIEETDILKNIIDRKMIKIISADSTNFLNDFIWILYLDFGNDFIKIEIEDIIAKLFNTIEDGGRHKISKCEIIDEGYSKKINRVVNDIFIVSNIFEFESYKITYPRVIIFNFDDCNLVIEKRWIFSLAGFIVRLEPLDTENFGLYNETQFWYDSDSIESEGKMPIVTQIVHSLKQDKDISIKNGLDL